LLRPERRLGDRLVGLRVWSPESFDDFRSA
jgi:hypothetical protein